MCDGRCGRRYVHRVGWQKGQDVIATGKESMALFTFTPEERRFQDARLQPVIADAWAAEGGVAWWRAQTEIADVHRQLAPRYRVEGTDAWIAYLGTVLAMAWEATGYFVPVDFWPFIPPPAAIDATGHTGFKVVHDTQRAQAKVFDPATVRANRHYGLLIGHLIVCPDPIHTAAEIPEPAYPWPFVIVLSAGATPRVERQEDIGHGQWKIAERIERRLFKNAQQARVYGASPAAVERQAKVARARQDAARVVCRLYDEGRQSGKASGAIIGNIIRHDDFIAACSVPGAEVGVTERTVRALHKEGRLARGEPLPRSGRPTKR